MKRRTLLPVSATLAFAIVEISRLLTHAPHVRLPFIGWVTPLAAWFILTLLFLISLAVLNPYILAWWKEHGRDIEEEEKYELHGSGMVSLNLRQADEEAASRKDERFS
jgi:hypothetical protein